MATKKGRIRPPGYTDIVHPETDADIVLYDNVVSGLTSGNVKDAIDELETNKANKTDVLLLDNTTAFTPNADYEPATKLYVDLVQDDLDAHKADIVPRVETLEEAVGNIITVDSWKTIQEIVRSGNAANIFDIGDQLVATYDGNEIVWDIIGINHDTPSDTAYEHSLTIQAHDCIMNCEWDAGEWLFFAESELAAGTYYFYDSYNAVNYQFTTTVAIPIGGSIDVSAWGDSQNPTEVKTYDASENLIETLAVSEASTGTELTTCNDLRRVRYGSNNYIESNIREWLNSEEASYSFDKQTIYDRPSTASPYDGAGFLYNLDPDLKAVIGVVDKQVARNTVTDGGGQDTFSEKVFLLSRVEVYGGDEGVVTGESPYEFYSNLAASPTTGALDGRIKYLSGSPRYWWLRSPHTGYSSFARRVDTTGFISHYLAISDHGLAPACCII